MSAGRRPHDGRLSYVVCGDSTPKLTGFRRAKSLRSRSGIAAKLALSGQLNRSEPRNVASADIWRKLAQSREFVLPVPTFGRTA